MTGLRLRPFRIEDEPAALAAHEQLLVDDFTFLLEHDAADAWPTYLQRLRDHRMGIGLAPDRVPAALLAATVDGELVGRTSIRFELNDYLALAGGHIGYAVVPAYRRRGWATEILRQSLVIARAEGVDDVLVTCATTNIGSATVIERCGGELDGEVDDPVEGIRKRRYWIR